MGVLLGGQSGWPSTLLAAFVLSVCFFSTEARIQVTNISVEPPKPMEGGRVRLTPVSLPPVPSTCRWFRGEWDSNETILVYYFYPRHFVWKAAQFTGRETIRSDCSLEITDLNITDLANYVVLIEGPEGSRVGTVELIIHYPYEDEPNEFGRGFNKTTIVGMVFGSLGAAVVLVLVLFTIYYSSHREIPTLPRAAPQPLHVRKGPRVPRKGPRKGPRVPRQGSLSVGNIEKLIQPLASCKNGAKGQIIEVLLMPPRLQSVPLEKDIFICYKPCQYKALLANKQKRYLRLHMWIVFSFLF
ncbi:carcinoembryonic antigen-related cell adhesion molecule 3-like [Anolis carolinensis]|uniref:carcinoembryonic antigen-related cell adhesion molecule 3-like n=1 Tax=Anolis carolinensis TaxID=28377 RepID=UPI002F2B16A9